MFEVSKEVIKITKGDSATLNVSLTNQDGSPYDMREGDTLTLTVTNDLKKPYNMQIVSSSPTIELKPSDTNKLIVGGNYYDIQLETADGDIYTVVGITNNAFNFIVYDEITK